MVTQTQSKVVLMTWKRACRSRTLPGKVELTGDARRGGEWRGERGGEEPGVEECGGEEHGGEECGQLAPM